METILIAYRDIVTQAGGTIIEHNSISLMNRESAVYFGWIPKERERHFVEKIAAPNLVAFDRHLSTIEEIAANADQNFPYIYLCDTSQAKLYHVRCRSVAVFVGGTYMLSPRPEATPPYMRMAKCPAWFELKGRIVEISTAELNRWTNLTPACEEKAVSEQLPAEDVVALLKKGSSSLWRLQD